MLLLLVFEGTDLDREFARYFFDPDQAAFPLRKAWLLDAVLHHGAKQASFILVAASLFYCWQGWKNRLTWLPPRNALLAATGMLAIPLATSTLKLLTYRHCPWDIVDFGGFAPYLHLFEVPPPGIKAGQCLPAGHASAGFLWLQPENQGQAQRRHPRPALRGRQFQINGRGARRGENGPRGAFPVPHPLDALAGMGDQRGSCYPDSRRSQACVSRMKATRFTGTGRQGMDVFKTTLRMAP